MGDMFFFQPTNRQVGNTVLTLPVNRWKDLELLIISGFYQRLAARC